MNIVLTGLRLAALQAELNEYLADHPEAFGMTVEQYVQSQVESRADAALQRYSVIKPYAFVERFTPTEYSGIVAAAASDANVAGYLALLKTKELVNLRSPSVAAGLNYLEQHGLIAEGRAAQIAAIV